MGAWAARASWTSEPLGRCKMRAGMGACGDRGCRLQRRGGFGVLSDRHLERASPASPLCCLLLGRMGSSACVSFDSCMFRLSQQAVHSQTGWPAAANQTFVAVAHGCMQKCAQLLLTLDNLANRSQYLNARTTFTELLAYGVVPIVNENVSGAARAARGRARLVAATCSLWHLHGYLPRCRMLLPPRSTPLREYSYLRTRKDETANTHHRLNASRFHPCTSRTGHGGSSGAALRRQRHAVCAGGGAGAGGLAVPAHRRGLPLHG